MVKTLLADKEDRIAAMEGLVSRCAIYCSIHRISKPDIRITQQHNECRKQLESDLAMARSNAERRENEKVSLQVQYGIINIASKIHGADIDSDFRTCKRGFLNLEML